jgi:hypothetical protein
VPSDAFKETDGWKTAQPSDQLLRGKWWEIFGDPQLTTLENELTVSNQNLKVATARFTEARAMVHFNRAAQFPTISTSPGIASVRESANTPYLAATKSTGDFALPLDFSYELDVWGRVRRTVSASREEAQATAGDLETVSLSLHAELAFDYFELRSADAQKQLLDDTVKTYQDALQLTTNRFDGGAAPKSDVAQARTQLEATLVQDTGILWPSPKRKPTIGSQPRCKMAKRSNATWPMIPGRRLLRQIANKPARIANTEMKTTALKPSYACPAPKMMACASTARDTGSPEQHNCVCR